MFIFIVFIILVYNIRVMSKATPAISTTQNTITHELLMAIII